jgi:hypothetical protein
MSSTMAEAEAAIAGLARRVADMEDERCGIDPGSKASNLDQADSTAALIKTVGELKKLRTALFIAAEELDSRLEALKSMELDNAKLRYQVKHLKRSLEGEELYVRAPSRRNSTFSQHSERFVSRNICMPASSDV